MTDLKLAAQKALEAMTQLENYAARNVCTHEETKRGGAIWEICCWCGARWADDEGGKPPYAEPPELIAAAEAKEALRSALQHQEEREPVETWLQWRQRDLRWKDGWGPWSTCNAADAVAVADMIHWQVRRVSVLSPAEIRSATPPLLRESAEKVQMPDKARAGIEVLHRVVESLLTTSRYVDEEGEATHALADLSACIADPPFKLRDAPTLPLCPFCDERHEHCDSPGAIITGTTGCEKIDVPARARLAAIGGRASIKGEGGDV